MGSKAAAYTEDGNESLQTGEQSTASFFSCRCGLAAMV